MLCRIARHNRHHVEVVSTTSDHRPHGRPALPRSRVAQRRRRRRLLIPLTVLVLVAVGAAAVVIVGGNDRAQVAAQYADAYVRGDDAAMYALLTAADRRAITADRFAELHREARELVTTTEMRRGAPEERANNSVAVPVVTTTRMFGTLRAELTLPIVDDAGRSAIDWSEHLVFPGLHRGEQLSRTTELPPRADLLARDGTVLAQGPERTPNSDPALSSIVGSMGPIPADQRREYEAAGVPADASVGLTGLERIFDARLRGTPGGTLQAGSRTLATAAPREASPVRTSIAPAVQRAAVRALDGRLGGIAAVRPSNGQILALAGAAFSGLQPPGSVFKIVTLAAALEHGLAKPSSEYPVVTETLLSGVALQNADNKPCGGTLSYSFAQSCNTVFGPLGAKLGAARLVEAAESFGFNASLGIPGAAVSSIPTAEELGDDELVLGSTAIGQGRLQATALQMALVAATVAERGQLPKATAAVGDRVERTRVLPQQVASQVVSMMVRTVSEGTGTRAAISGVKVGGKTGTAELRSTQGTCDPANEPPGGCPDPNDTTDTTAWFAGFAPADKPRVAIAVQLAGAGQGGATAAPAFRDVALAALKSS